MRKQDLYEYQYTTPNKKVVKNLLPALSKPSGKSKKQASMALGVFLEIIGFFGLWGIPGMITEQTGILKILFTLLIYGGIFGIGFKKIKEGKDFLGRYSRYFRYMKVLESHQFATIEELAGKVAKSTKIVIKDLEFMMDQKWFLEGHLDQLHSHFMLTDQAYEQYQLAEKSRKIREQEERERQEKENDPVQKELLQLLEEGNGYVREIHSLNDAILGAEVSQKLDKIEETAVSIFDLVQRRPEKMPDLRKFMRYYLPITIKVVTSYRDFENEKNPSKQLLESKKEIEETLDKVCSAFIKLREKLFQEDVLDISTDLDVLEAMMSQEGLLSDELSIYKNFKF